MMMADSSIVTLGTARSLLVDSSAYDSRIVETTRDHTFMGMTCDDEEGMNAFYFLSLLPFYTFPSSCQITLNNCYCVEMKTAFRVEHLMGKDCYCVQLLRGILQSEVFCFTSYVGLKVEISVSQSRICLSVTR